ncbi:hypothetical protein ACOSQ2_004632 [Xanthoceras sorbifolium]
MTKSTLLVSKTSLAPPRESKDQVYPDSSSNLTSDFSSPISLSLPPLCGLCSGQSWGAFELLVPLSISCRSIWSCWCAQIGLVICYRGDPIGVFFLDLLLVVSDGAGVFGSGGLELLWCSILAL